MVDALLVGVFTVLGVILGFIGGKSTICVPTSAPKSEKPVFTNPLEQFFGAKSKKTDNKDIAVDLLDEYLNGPGGDE